MESAVESNFNKMWNRTSIEKATSNAMFFRKYFHYFRPFAFKNIANAAFSGEYRGSVTVNLNKNMDEISWQLEYFGSLHDLMKNHSLFFFGVIVTVNVKN